MRTALLSFFVLVCVALAGPAAVTGQTKYGVTVRTLKPEALTKAKTYIWRNSQPAFNQNIDAAIVAAVDRELVAKGLTKVTSGRSDLAVTYASVSRTDVATKDVGSATGSGREIDIGLLVVDLSDAASRELLFRVRADTPIERNAAALAATINTIVTAIFEKYPAAQKP